MKKFTGNANGDFHQQTQVNGNGVAKGSPGKISANGKDSEGSKACAVMWLVPASSGMLRIEIEKWSFYSQVKQSYLNLLTSNIYVFLKRMDVIICLNIN